MRIAQFFSSGVALFLLGMGLLTALWDFPTRGFLLVGSVAVMGALVALRSLWRDGWGPLRRGVGVALGALLTLSLSFSPLSAAASLVLFLAGAILILQGLNRWARRS